MAFTDLGSLGSNFSTATAPTIVLTTTAGASVGDLVVVCGGRTNATGDSTGMSLADSKGNTWVAAGGAQQSANPAMGAAIWYSILTTAIVSGDTITMTGSTGHGYTISADRWSGVNTTTPVDAGPVNGTLGTLSGSLTLSAMTTTANALVYMNGVLQANRTATMTPAPSGMTERYNLLSTTATARRMNVAAATFATAGSKTPSMTLASGTSFWAGTSVAFRTASPPGAGTGTGTFTFAGTASGKRPAKGSATGTLAYSGAGVGKRTPKASGAGTLAYAGTATGTTTKRGTATGALTYVGTATGKRNPTATGTGTVAWSGAASGVKAPRATGVGTLAWVGTAAGSAPSLDVNDGAGSGETAWAGVATGATSRTGTAAGSVAWVGAATGTAPSVGVSEGSAAGVTTWTGTAVGKRVAKGTATGATVWVGAGAGKSAPSGSAAGVVVWTSTAVGARAAQGMASGATEWTGVALGSNISGRDITVTATLVPRAWAGTLAGRTWAGTVTDRTWKASL